MRGSACDKHSQIRISARRPHRRLACDVLAAMTATLRRDGYVDLTKRPLVDLPHSDCCGLNACDCLGVNQERKWIQPRKP